MSSAILVKIIGSKSKISLVYTLEPRSPNQYWGNKAEENNTKIE